MNFKKIALVLVFGIWALAVSVAFAQYPSQGTPPLVLCNGGYIPQGTPCGQGGGMVGNYGGMRIPIPQGVGMGQPFNTVVNGQRVTMVCSLADRAVTAVVDGAGMALLGFGVAKLFHRDARTAAIGAGAVGAAYGGTIGCNPMMVNDGDQQGGYQQRPMQQGVIISQQGGGTVQRGTMVVDQSICQIGDRTMRGVSAEDCTYFRGLSKVSAPTEVAPPPQQLADTGGAAQQEKRHCAAGSKWLRLNWKGENGAPDHPQHGKFVCLPDGDTHRFPGE